MKQEFSFIRLVQFDESFLCLVGQVLCQVIRFCIAADVRKQTLDEHSPLHTGIVIKVKPEQPSNAPSPMLTTLSGIVIEVKFVQ